MYCKYCGQSNIPRAKYCKNCGKITPKLVWLKRSPLKLGITSVVIIIAGLFTINSGAVSNYINIFPFVPMNPKIVTLSCSYAGKNLQVQTTAYGNIDNYYKNYNSSEKTGFIDENQFDNFVYINPRDKTIKNLVNSISKIGDENFIKDDRKLELALCFVQNIPYDDEKASKMLASDYVGNTSNTEQYPYQTLFLNKGICTDKTYLGSVVAKELGYGTGILAFDQQQHMALGLSAPIGYTSFSSSYAYVEMTSLAPPGLIPSDIDPNNGMPISLVKALKQLGVNDDPATINFGTGKTINNPDLIIPINSGRIYTKIIAVKNLEKTIGDSINSLAAKKANLQTAYNNIGYWNNRQAQAYADYLATPSTTQICRPVYSYYPYYSIRQSCYTSNNFSKSLKYSSYSSAYNSYKTAINKYNSLFEDYDNTLNKIKNDIDKYQTYQYN